MTRRSASTPSGTWESGQNLAIGLYQRIGSETHKIDYWEGSNKDGMPQAIKALQNKPYTYGKMFVPHDAEGTESGTGKTRLATAKELWPNVENPVEDAVDRKDLSGVNGSPEVGALSRRKRP